MRRMRWVLGCGLVALLLTGCPPTGDVPPFVPAEAGVVDPDDGGDVTLDGMPDVVADDMRVGDVMPDAIDGGVIDAEADGMSDGMADGSVRPACVDLDDDGYVVGEGCALPAGDCAPMDGMRAPGVAERCDGVDDDCDEAVDEEVEQVGVDCTTAGLGVCRPGRIACTDGALGCVTDVRPAAVEACDGLDDDCDGAIDEDDPGGGVACDTGGAGACARGMTRCGAEGVVCTGPSPVGEVCNGVDDDCDDVVDEGAGGAECETGEAGVCGAGVEVCAGGEVACTARVAAGDERCNGLDDDCDGSVDEGFVGLDEACEVGEGECRRASVGVCSADGARVVCDAAAGDGRAERCDGADDDCDGMIDEGFAVGEPCTDGVGACAVEGQVVCLEGGEAGCDVVAGEGMGELCNDIDDDCDGMVDEDFPVGVVCEDVSGACVAAGEFVCGGEGVVCDAPPVMPVDEACNGADDDCDARVDEGFEGLGEGCEVGVGACRRQGVVGCVDGGAACGVEPGAPSAEACNGVDDDCDGLVDDRAPCLGPRAGVARLSFAGMDDPRCADLDGDGVADNALGALADLLGATLARDEQAGRRVLLLRVPAFDGPDEMRRVELVEARPAVSGPAPLLRSVTPEGRGRQVIRGVARAGGVLSTPAPAGSVLFPSPLFYTRDVRFADVTLAELDAAGFAGEAVALGAAGLQINDGRLTGAFDRAALVALNAEATARCRALGEMAPAACAGLVAAGELESLLVADLEGGRVSACFVVDAPALADAATVPVGGLPCRADSACYAGLACRPVPTVSAPAEGAALALRCGVPGAGGGAVGAGCTGDDDCEDALCVEATAAGGTCSGLCGVDADCPAGLVCRGVARAVEGATSLGGASAAVCVPVVGSGDGCSADEDCGAGEICGVWLEGAGVAGGAVSAAGRCQVADPAGAARGERCFGPADCAQGGGCVADLDGVLRCAAPCDDGGQCEGGRRCFDRVLAEAADGAVVHGFCLPVPPGLGSGAACEADVECAAGEVCAVTRLASGGVERYCGVGEGFMSVGGPCGEDGDCASGRCAEGACAGACDTDAQCGPSLGCVADALLDAGGRPVGGLCLPASAGCGVDGDCAVDPACGGGRCVCEGGMCRVGCRDDGACGDGLCQGGSCAPYCRDDGGEPDDSLEEAAVFPVGLRAPEGEVRARLCALSPVDWYRVEPGGRPLTVRLDRALGGARFALDLFDGAGGLLVEGTPLDPVEAIELRWVPATLDPVFVRVRASGLVDGAPYRLSARLEPVACDDQREDPPSDVPAGAVQLAIRPGVEDDEGASGRICAGDADWYAVWLDGGDTLTTGFNPAAPNLAIRVWGPDVPGLPTSAVRAAGGVFSPEALRCDVDAGVCRYAGADTRIVCVDDADCAGAPWYLEVAGRDAGVAANYGFVVEVERALDRACIPDRWEPDDAALSPSRLVGAFPSQISGSRWVADTTIEVGDLRLCPGDVDVFATEADAGERLVGAMARSIDDGPLELRFLRREGDAWALVGETEVDGLTGTAGQVIAADGLYAIAVAAPDGGARGTYRLGLRRETSATDDRGCADAIPIALDGSLEVDSTTAGRADSVEPLRCLGGGGPDRIYAVTPSTGGVLSVTVTGQAPGVDPAVSVRAACDVRVSELACEEDDVTADDPTTRAGVEVPVEAGDTVFVVVDSFDAAGAGAYRLSLRVR